MTTASWVIVDKNTERAIFETHNSDLIPKINTEKYKAIPIKEYLFALNRKIKNGGTKWRKPDQIIQPWQHGHGETKSTCLWLRGLPKLVQTKIVEGRHGRVWREPPSPDRWKKRSITYQGIADAMAEQWGAIA